MGNRRSLPSLRVDILVLFVGYVAFVFWHTRCY